MADEYIKIPITTTAVLTPVADTDVDSVFSRIAASLKDPEAVETIRANYENHQARPDPVVDGRPRMLHVTAWIVHEGINNNRDVFLAEDLQAVVESGKLFQQPYGGIIDFNHDLTPIGYWYNAEYAQDPKNGKYGILAHGAVWAWLYPHITDKMLAEQVRSEKIDTSMMALSKDTQMKIWEDGRYARVVRQPVFTGASLLDEPPADPDATGLVAEDPSQQTAEERKNTLLAASQQPNTEENMDELKTLLAGLDEKIVEKITAALESKADEIRAQLAENEAKVTDLTAQVEALTQEKAALQTSVDEKELALSAAKDEVTALTEQVASLTEKVDAFTAQEAERQRAEVAKARLAELPEAVRARFDNMPETKRNELLAVWASLDEDAWTLRKEELGLGLSNSRLPNINAVGNKGGPDLKRFIRSN